MCRMIAYLGPEITLESLVFEPEHSLNKQAWAPRRQSHGSINADGFGVGWYSAIRPEPARYRRGVPIWTDASFRNIAGSVASGAILAAVRDATPGSAVVETGAAPFTSGRYLFAHQGAVEGFHRGGGPSLRRTVSEPRDAGIEGSSDSEVLFAMVLDRLDADASMGEALRGAVETVKQLAGGRMNLLLCDGEQIAATAFGEPLFALRTGAPPEASIIVASEPFDDDPDWEEIPDMSLLVARPDSLEIVGL